MTYMYPHYVKQVYELITM